jgi:hypothetical protein
MTRSFLHNRSLESLIEVVKIDERKKEALRAMLPRLDQFSRKKLLDILFQIYLLNLEEDETIARVKEFFDSKI